MVEMLNPHVFHSKVIHQEAELDRPPFVFPQTWGGECFVVSFQFQLCPQEVVGQDSCLWESVTPMSDFKLDPSIPVGSGRIVLCNKFIWDSRQFDPDVFLFAHRCVEVEVC